MKAGNMNVKARRLVSILVEESGEFGWEVAFAVEDLDNPNCLV